MSYLDHAKEVTSSNYTTASLEGDSNRLRMPQAIDVHGLQFAPWYLGSEEKKQSINSGALRTSGSSQGVLHSMATEAGLASRVDDEI